MDHKKINTNLASLLLPAISGGQADRDFAKELRKAITAVEATGKKAAVTITVEVALVKTDRGGILFTADAECTKLPKLPNQPTQMHVMDDGSVVSQLDFLMGGGRDESKRRVELTPIEKAAAAPEIIPDVPEKPAKAELEERQPRQAVDDNN